MRPGGEALPDEASRDLASGVEALPDKAWLALV